MTVLAYNTFEYSPSHRIGAHKAGSHKGHGTARRQFQRVAEKLESVSFRKAKSVGSIAVNLAVQAPRHRAEKQTWVTSIARRLQHNDESEVMTRERVRSVRGMGRLAAGLIGFGAVMSLNVSDAPADAVRGFVSDTQSTVVEAYENIAAVDPASAAATIGNVAADIIPFYQNAA